MSSLSRSSKNYTGVLHSDVSCSLMKSRSDLSNQIRNINNTIKQLEEKNEPKELTEAKRLFDSVDSVVKSAQEKLPKGWLKNCINELAKTNLAQRSDWNRTNSRPERNPYSRLHFLRIMFWAIWKGHILHMTMAHSKLKKEIRELEKLRTFYKLKLDNMVSDLVYAANPWVIYRNNHKSCWESSTSVCLNL